MMERDEIIRKIRRDYKAWTHPEGYMLRRVVTRKRVQDGSLGDLDAQLTRAIDGDKDVEAELCEQASDLLYELAETKPVDWFPKELAMLASVKLHELAIAPPPRHKGRDTADTLSRNLFIIRKVREVCEEHDYKPTRNAATGWRDSACSLVAEALHLEESLVNRVWKNRRRQFGVS
jgi:hypothetical protein